MSPTDPLRTGPAHNCWFRLYLARISNGKEDTLKFAIGLYGVIGVGPAPVELAGLLGEAVVA